MLKGKDYQRETSYGTMTAQYNEVLGWTVYLDTILVKSFGDNRMAACDFIDKEANEDKEGK